MLCLRKFPLHEYLYFDSIGSILPVIYSLYICKLPKLQYLPNNFCRSTLLIWSVYCNRQFTPRGCAIFRFQMIFLILLVIQFCLLSTSILRTTIYFLLFLFMLSSRSTSLKCYLNLNNLHNLNYIYQRNGSSILSSNCEDEL